MALSVLTALRFSAMTCVTPFIDMKGVVRPPCLLTAPFRYILQHERQVGHTHAPTNGAGSEREPKESQRKKAREMKQTGLGLGSKAGERRQGRCGILNE